MKFSWVSPILAAATALLSVRTALAEIRTETVEYRDGETVLEGYLVYDDAIVAPRPGVMVVHTWMGLTDFEKARARELAEMGYVALAADIYGRGVRPSNTDEANELATLYRENRELLRSRANAGANFLRDLAMTESDRIAAIGYCFGGGTVLELARSGASVAGVVSFHGNLDTPDPQDAADIRSRVLVLHGVDDPFVPIADVNGFIEEMQTANVDWQMVMYGNAVHSFTDPGADDDPFEGTAYDEDVAQEAWATMQRFFDETFLR
ncbi:dienelactone hydrolase [Leptolyngbya valderiana BDU 20041]|uniref:dienelactone hydrolase family protein n=1 Tax=Baaleninema simplex TaxID=2862350 RepID=UPI000347D0D0|nr:dienelactone hydrolase family protein [Baaleninema simplex]MDC0835983.1 dienelactone hydrolase family protein [Geitlerinema sp. CS-897]OAB62414.1 dienelactone hydrolase [Leptolyngbya valderiana BDU 20041]PPT07065.1 dienelactone hydrolase family protein [Geitlerinema sp. FC II]